MVTFVNRASLVTGLYPKDIERICVATINENKRILYTIEGKEGLGNAARRRLCLRDIEDAEKGIVDTIRLDSFERPISCESVHVTRFNYEHKAKKYNEEINNEIYNSLGPVVSSEFMEVATWAISCYPSYYMRGFVPTKTELYLKKPLRKPEYFEQYQVNLQKHDNSTNILNLNFVDEQEKKRLQDVIRVCVKNIEALNKDLSLRISFEDRVRSHYGNESPDVLRLALERIPAPCRTQSIQQQQDEPTIKLTKTIEPPVSCSSPLSHVKKYFQMTSGNHVKNSTSNESGGVVINVSRKELAERRLERLKGQNVLQKEPSESQRYQEKVKVR